MRNIGFSPPDISEQEIAEVIDTLRSGWITTGPKTKLFEQRISEYVGTSKTVCLSSCTAAMELTLRILGIGPGDEVITSAYTYTASASVIHHVGAKIVLVDTAPDSYEMDYEQLAEVITRKTKAIIPVDIGGVMCDYDRIFEVVESKRSYFEPSTPIQEAFDRIIVMADAAHSFGATYHGRQSGTVADFTAFSFHAVKNLTTAEGGAVTWRDHAGTDNEQLYNEYQLLSMHGQSKDAKAKLQPGAWEYDIVCLGYKCNMTDITAAIGLKQLERYESLLARRRELGKYYSELLVSSETKPLYLSTQPKENQGSYHLFLTRTPDFSYEERNAAILQLANSGIACNVHYKPLPMHTAYKKIGFSISDYPNALWQFENELTLPLHTLLSNEDAAHIVQCFLNVVNGNRLG